MIKIVPAIDLIDGRCVRLTKGDYVTKKVYDGSPADVARSYADCGVERIHLVDLDGARMILGADVREGRVAVAAWQDSIALGVEDLVSRFLPFGLQECIVTEISRDGMLQGPASALYVRLQRQFPQLSFTVSGGISGMNDIRALNALKLRKVIVGKALYENRITLEDIRSWSQSASSPASM